MSSPASLSNAISRAARSWGSGIWTVCAFAIRCGPPKSMQVTKTKITTNINFKFRFKKRGYGDSLYDVNNLKRLILLRNNLVSLVDEHLASSSEITSSQRIEIDTTRYRFTQCITTIPIRRTQFTMIDTSRQMP